MSTTVDVKVDLSKMVALRERIREIQARDAKVRIGVFSSAGQVPGGDISMATLAAIHEFGSEKAHLPERSFIRATMRARKAEGIAMCAKVCKAFIEDRISLPQALGILGEWGVSRIRDFIRTNQVKPPDTEATIDRKGSSVTLIDTGQLMNAISYVTPFGEGGSGSPVTEDE